MNDQQGTPRDVLKQALALASSDRPAEAVALLEGGLIEARRLKDQGGIRTLAKNAGLICAHSGKLAVAAAYFEEALGVGPRDAHLQLAVADAYRRLGLQEKASQALALALELATQAQDAELAQAASRGLSEIDH